MTATLWRYFFTGLLTLVPAWATFLILSALVQTLNQWAYDLLGTDSIASIPGLSLFLLCLLILSIGAVANHVIGNRTLQWTERWIDQIPLVRSIYLTLKGMADLLNFRARFGRSTVVAFPFPRDGLWALGFVMGSAPRPLQIVPMTDLLMVFVPSAIHPFTGYLAFVPKTQVRPINLAPEDAMKMQFSAGFYKPGQDWLQAPKPLAYPL